MVDGSGCWKRTLADLGGGVAARRAGFLLVVERAATVEKRLVNLCPAIVLSVSSTIESLRSIHRSGGSSTYPQRLQRPWVLVWLAMTVRIHVRSGRFLRRVFNIPLAEAGGTLRCNCVSALTPPIMNACRCSCSDAKSKRQKAAWCSRSMASWGCVGGSKTRRREWHRESTTWMTGDRDKMGWERTHFGGGLLKGEN